MDLAIRELASFPLACHERLNVRVRCLYLQGKARQAQAVCRLSDRPVSYSCTRTRRAPLWYIGLGGHAWALEAHVGHGTKLAAMTLRMVYCTFEDDAVLNQEELVLLSKKQPNGASALLRLPL